MPYPRDASLHVLASLALVLVGCGDSGGNPTTTGITTNETGATGTDASEGGASGSAGSLPTTSGDGLTGGGSEASSGDSNPASSSDSSASTGEIGTKFDLGGGNDIGGGTMGGPGSCRPSEIYGAAGGFPAFTDPAYAPFLNKSVAIVTHNNWDQAPINYSLTIVDISGPPPPPNANYLAPLYHQPAWTLDNLGRIFGLTLDSDGNIFVAASTVYGATSNPGVIKRIDRLTGEITVFATLPNNGPALGNINYDCVSETIYASNHEDGRIYQLDMSGQIVSTYHHATKNITLGPAADPGEPNGAFFPLGDRPWAVQSNAGRLYYSLWVEDQQGSNPNRENEVWSVGYSDMKGIPDPATAKFEFSLPVNSQPVSDLSFAQTGWMLVAQRTMSGDMSTGAHQSTTFEYDYQNGTWVSLGTTYIVGELLPYSAAGGVDHSFEPDGYVWMTGDALDFYTPEVVYGLQGTPYGGGGIETSTLIDMDHETTQQDKTVYGDVEVPIPGDAAPVPPPS